MPATPELVELLVFMLLLGLVVGSFANVVAYRVPRGESVVRPASRCPGCETAILPRHNVPVVGWLVLGGRCASCQMRISPRYPVVEAVTGLLFAVTTLRLAQLGLLSALPAYLWLVGAGVALTLIDFEFRRLPNAIVLPSYPVVAVLLTVSAALRHDWGSLARAGLGGAILFAFFYSIAVLRPAWMGMGDAKLSGVLGGLLAYLSWPALAIGAYAGFFFGACYGIALMLLRRGGRRTMVAFGPFMLAGALFALFAAANLTHLYDSLLVNMAGG
jgi:leader peptidase (prepilin peptidase)/N-methyltransferase